MEAIFEYFEYYRILLSSFPFIIQVALITIFISVIATVFFFASAFFLRRSREKKDLVVDQLYPEIFTFIKDILDSEEIHIDTDIYANFVEKFGKLNKKIYGPIVLALENLTFKTPSLSEDSINYYNLIKGLKIDTHLEKELEFSNTYRQIRAFQSLSRLSLTVSDSKILPYTYSRNSSLKKESRSTYIGVSNNDPFKFFDIENYNLNYWDQILLLQQLELHHKNNLPNFSKWIKYSKDKSQIIFLIRAVAYFKQLHSITTLKEMITTIDHDIRREAILALGKMKVSDIEETLKNIYYNQPNDCQKAIIEAMALIQSGQSLSFLKNAYFETSDPDTKKLIAEAIYLYGDEGKIYFEKLCKIEIGFNALILQHVKNPLVPSPLKETLLKTKKSTKKSTKKVASIIPVDNN